MTSDASGSGADDRPDRDRPDRLAPRPHHRPPVSPQTQAIFGRPRGVSGAFDEKTAIAATRNRTQPQVTDPGPVLKEAFSRPDGQTDSLQRDPLATYGMDLTPDKPEDPWRNPHTPVGLSDPARPTSADPAPTTPAPKVGVRDVLLGRGVTWKALGILAVLALAIALVGGLIGRTTAEVAVPLFSDDVELNQVGGGQPQSDVEKVAENVAPAVVTVDVRAGNMGGTGSGVVIDKRGYIATNNHVVSMAANANGNSKVEIVTNDGTRKAARIVGRDTKTDVAVIKVDDLSHLAVAKLGNSDDLRIGQAVTAFGSPLGLRRTVTTGIVSALHRAVPLRPDDTSDTDAVLDAIQTDAAITHGNSGGPLVDAEGKVVGINTAGINSSAGLGFAIPVNEVVQVAGSLIKTGKVTHAQIGVTARSMQNDSTLGAQLRNVSANSAASRAGLREGDVITKWGDQDIEDADMLAVAIRKSEVGKEVSVSYFRDGRTLRTKVTPDKD